MNETKQKGLSTELHCELAFTEIGILLSQPIVDDSRYDYIADLGDHFIKIQCKTCSVGDDGTYIKFSTRSSRSNSNGVIFRKYNKNEIDYFYTYFNNKSYLIPVEECSSQKTLRFSPADNNQKYNKAEEYELNYILFNRENFTNIQNIKINYITKNENICQVCGEPIGNTSTFCKKCSGLNNRVTERPSRETLKELIRNNSFVQIGLSYNVTNNAIKKWCESYNLPKKRKDIDKLSDKEWESI